MTRVSVVVPVYNGERYLGEAIESVLAQTHPADEIVAVDDGSTDGSIGILKRYAGVRIVREPHAGAAQARNRGVEEASFELIAFLDADDLWHGERLEREMQALGEAPELGFVVSAQENFLTEGLAEPPAWIDPRSLGTPQHGFSTNALTVWRSTFKRVGPFDGAKVICEDSDWFVRALDLGVPYRHLDAVLVRRRIHADNLSGKVRGTPAHVALMARVLHESIKRRRA